PIAQADLHSFFAQPTDPRSILQPLLRYEHQCEDIGSGQLECDDDIDFEGEYLNAFLRPHSDFDWTDGHYKFMAEDQLQAAIHRISDQVREKGFTLGD